jgi:signal transduction histidine kinase/molybdopterin-guanine dinucleotide biosynthesis protein A
VSASLDHDSIPIPILVVSHAGNVTPNRAFKGLLGRHEATSELRTRFEIAPWGGRTFEGDELPWERVLRQDFHEEEVWYDRVTSSRVWYCVRGRANEQGGVLALEDMTDHSPRLAEFADATFHAALEPTLEGAAGALAPEVAKVVGADAVFFYITTRPMHSLRVLATSRPDLAPGVLGAALAAVRTRTHREVAAIDSPSVTCSATRSLLAAGMRSMAAFPLAIGPDTRGALVAAWHQSGALQPAERKLLEIVSRGCQTVLATTHTRYLERSECARLHRLRSAALEITDLTSSHRLMKQLVEQACALTGARGGALGVLEPDGIGLADVIVVEHSGRDSRELESDDAQAVLQELATAQYGRGRSKGTKPILGTALRINRHPIGSVYVVGKYDGTTFTEDDRRDLESFGAQAALAIEYSIELQAASDREHQLARLHDELAAVVAHEMRTPLSSLLLQFELLLEHGERQDDQILVPARTLGRMRTAGNQLSRLIQDLLDAARIELKRVTLERRRCVLGEVISELVAQLKPTFGDRPIALNVEDNVPPVLVDAERVTEIVTNLLENAAKYSSPDKPITVAVARDGRGVTISVEDEGNGIAPEDLPRLFDRFFQAKRGRTRKSGLGLGLYITKGLVEAHGGRIWVDSAPGRGSKFHVWLPPMEEQPS